jgi:hypothetical protein
VVDEDLDAFLEDHGKPCKVGAVDFVGILDAPGELLTLGGDGAVSNEYALTVKSSVIGQARIKHGTPLTHDGVAYTARQPRALDDGLFSIIPLSKI